MVTIKVDRNNCDFTFFDEITERDRKLVIATAKIMFLDKKKIKLLEKKEFEINVEYNFTR